MGRIGPTPVPYYLSDPDYFPRTDPRRAAHLRRIEVQARITRRIDASAGDGSYSVTVRKEDVDAG